VVTGYGLTFGGFLLLGGRAADLLGRRRVLLAGLAVFTAASLGCGLATSDSFLIPMRCLQGLGAAIVLPAALSIVMNMFPEGAGRNKALGVWGALGASGATAGWPGGAGSKPCRNPPQRPAISRRESIWVGMPSASPMASPYRAPRARKGAFLQDVVAVHLA
jgi:MFS family permease